MKNKFLIGILTFFAAIFTSIVILNFTNSSLNKSYYFDRKFSGTHILEFVNDHDKLDKNSTYELCYSNTEISEGNQNLLSDVMEYKLSFSDCSFSNIKKNILKIPIKSNIFMVEKNYVVYSLNSRLHQLNLNTYTTIISSINKIDISFLISLKNLPNKYLFFGEVFQDSNYKTGFFILDMLTNKITPSKVLNLDSEKFNPEIIAMHSGVFQRLNDNSISYTCDKNPNVFLFNTFGLFVNELITNDDTPMPKIIKNSNGDCYFSRDGLGSTNSGIFINKKNIFVFSMASNFKDKIIIDQYSKANNKYIQSFKLNYKNRCNTNIVNIFIEDNLIVLKFKSNYASFKFSRYNDENFY